MSGATRLAGLVVALAVVSSALAAPAAAGHGGEEFRIALDADGDAEVSVTYTYDLETTAERDAFESLSANETARERLATRFENRMSGVAADAGNATGRSMSVDDAAIDVESTDEVGVVTLTLRWEKLAAVDGDRLVVTEPFASGFEPDRRFVIAPPEGYAVADASPAPSGDAAATWTAGTSLDGFKLTAAPDDGATTTATDADGAGPGAVVALVAVALAAAALPVRR